MPVVKPAVHTREWLAIRAGRAAARASRLTGRGVGATMPGTIGMRIAPGLLGTLAAGRCITVVSATNGKTTTTAMLTAALADAGPVLTNAEGSNLARGVAAALMTDVGGQRRTCVFEVDELALESVSAQIRPAMFVLGNLSRDQLDRMNEVGAVAARWRRLLRAAADTGTCPVVVANCDDPVVAEAVLSAGGGTPALPVIWVAAGQLWTGDAGSCPRCGRPWQMRPDFACQSCGFARPPALWRLEGRELVAPGDARRPLNLTMPGRANRANAVMAIAAAAHAGVSLDHALEQIQRIQAVGGRYAEVSVDGARVRLLLAKNPAGWHEMLAQAVEEDAGGDAAPIVLALNAQGPDGRDTSWIWDVPFEQLEQRTLVAAGERAEDLALRLRYADLDFTVCPDPVEAVRLVARAGAVPRVELIANYTAFVATRARLLGR